MDTKRAVVLASGGLDSTTALAIARSQGFECYAISFRYGQRHSHELEAAGRVAKQQGAKAHKIVDVDLRSIGGSALTAEIEVPKDRTLKDMSSEIPVTYVPCRNLIFISIAAGWAETLGACDIFLGVNAVDYSGYPDCRPEFTESLERTLAVGTKAGVKGRPFKIHAPLIRMTKAEIIRTGLTLGVDYGITHSCYDPDSQGHACGLCDSCVIRRKGFEEATTNDPTRYVAAFRPDVFVGAGR